MFKLRKWIAVVLAVILCAGILPAFDFAHAEALPAAAQATLEEPAQKDAASDAGSEDPAAGTGAEEIAAPENETAPATGTSSENADPSKDVAETATGTEIENEAEAATETVASAPAAARLPGARRRAPGVSPSIEAWITDDSGSQVQFGSAESHPVTANMKYILYGSANLSSQSYSATVVLKNMNTGAGLDKYATITLPEGMAWVNDGSGDTAVQSHLDTTKGTNGVSVVNAPYGPGNIYVGGGTRTYYFSDSTETVSIPIVVRPYSRVFTQNISDAIQISLYESGSAVSQTSLDTVAVDTSLCRVTHTNRGNGNVMLDATEPRGDATDVVYMARISPPYGEHPIVLSMTRTITLSDPRAELKATSDLPADTTFDASGAAGGTYVISCSTPHSFSHNRQGVVYPVCRAADGWADGDRVTATSTVTIDYYNPYDPSGKTTVTYGPATKTWVVHPEQEDVVVNMGRTATIAERHVDITFTNIYNASIPNLSTRLGKFAISNRKFADSTPKTVEMHFDSTDMGVNAFSVPSVLNQGFSGDVFFKTINDPAGKTVTVNKAHGDASRSLITFQDLGIAEDDYITEVRFDLDTVPARTEYLYLWYNGVIFDDAKQPQATIELWDRGDDARTTSTGVGVTTTVFERQVGANSINNPTLTVNAGNTLTVSTLVGHNTSSFENGTVLTPVYYVRIDMKDEDGNFLTADNLKLLHNGENTIDQCDVSTYLAPDGSARIYRIDTSPLDVRDRALGPSLLRKDGTYGNISSYVVFDLATTPATPTQTQTRQNMIFFEDLSAPDTATGKGYHTKGDTYNLGDGSHYVGHYFDGHESKIQIVGITSLGVSTASKHEDDATYTAWSHGQDPITLGFTDGADVAVRLVNASGVAINTAASDVPTTIFIPIPKEGEDWGALMNNGEAFGFTAALTGPVDMSGADTAAGQTFTVEYGTVTPTDSGPALNSQTFTATPADYAAVNCVKITANNLPANGSDPDIYSFVLNIGVKDADENDLTDIVRPIYYQNLRNTTGTYAGWYYGGYYALQTKIKADYIVRHFQEQPDGTFVEATADAQTLSALIGATDYSVSAKTYPYYTYDPARTTYSDSGTAAGAAKLAVPDDSSLEINLYYMLDTHSVRYAYDGTVPSGAPALPAAVTVRRGETVTVAPAPTLTGYAFSGWDQTGTLTVTQDVVIKGSWTPYAPAKSDPPVTKVIQGDTLTEEATFAFSMEAVSNDAGLATADMPMPQGAANGKLTVTHRQKSARESVEFGELTFTQVGVYEYVIYEEAGSAAGFTYDTARHTVKYLVTADDTNQTLVVTRQIDGDTSGSVVEIVIENTYQRPKADDPTPTPKPDDPKPTPTPKPDDPKPTPTPKPSETPKSAETPKGAESPRTGDNTNLALWIGLMGASFAGLLAMLLLPRKRYFGKHSK